VAVLCWIIQAYYIVVIGRIIMEWIPVSYDHPLARLRAVLRSVTEPILGPLRRAVPPVRVGGMGLDLSPIILLVGLMLLANAVC
jgi:YggT family protein